MMAKLRTPLTSADHIIGEEIAAATLVEYGDYQCPFCAAAHSVVQQILSRCGNNLRFAFRHFPLTDMHPSAEPAAEVAEVAGRHGLFWPMHDSIYANQQRVSVPLLIALAANMELSSIELRDALTNHRLLSKIQCDFAGGVRSGVNGTPAFFINGLRFDGPLGAAGLPAAIEAVLDASGATTKVDSPRRVRATCKTESLQTSPRTPTVKAGKGSIMTVATRLQALATKIRRGESPRRINRREASTVLVAAAVAVAGPLRSARAKGVHLVVVDIQAVDHGFQVSKLLGRSVENDKDQKIGMLEDLVVTTNHALFGVLQAGAFLGLGGHLIAIPYDSLNISEDGRKIVLAGASKEEIG
jgi:protein-disulfide isomerase